MCTYPALHVQLGGSQQQKSGDDSASRLSAWWADGTQGEGPPGSCPGSQCPLPAQTPVTPSLWKEGWYPGAACWSPHSFPHCTRCKPRKSARSEAPLLQPSATQKRTKWRLELTAASLEGVIPPLLGAKCMCGTDEAVGVKLAKGERKESIPFWKWKYKNYLDCLDIYNSFINFPHLKSGIPVICE